MAWYIKGGLGGGFGGLDACEWERTDASSKEDAIVWAEQSAREEYESYGGMHGLFNYEEYMDENPDADEEDARLEEESDIDSWVEYEAKWFDNDPNEED